MIKTGLNILLYVTKEELINAKNGSTTLIASKVKTKEAEHQISVSLDACDILDNEVRVNLSLVQQSVEELGKTMGEALGKELERVFANLS